MASQDWVKRGIEASFLTLYWELLRESSEHSIIWPNDYVTKVYHFLLPRCSSSAFQPIKLRANTQSSVDSDLDSWWIINLSYTLCDESKCTRSQHNAPGSRGNAIGNCKRQPLLLRKNAVVLRWAHKKQIYLLFLSMASPGVLLFFIKEHVVCAKSHYLLRCF